MFIIPSAASATSCLPKFASENKSGSPDLFLRSRRPDNPGLPFRGNIVGRVQEKSGRDHAFIQGSTIESIVTRSFCWRSAASGATENGMRQGQEFPRRTATPTMDFRYRTIGKFIGGILRAKVLPAARLMRVVPTSSGESFADACARFRAIPRNSRATDRVRSEAEKNRGPAVESWKGRLCLRCRSSIPGWDVYFFQSAKRRRSLRGPGA